MRRFINVNQWQILWRKILAPNLHRSLWKSITQRNVRIKIGFYLSSKIRINNSCISFYFPSLCFRFCVVFFCVCYFLLEKRTFHFWPLNNHNYSEKCNGISMFLLSSSFVCVLFFIFWKCSPARIIIAW